MFRQAHDDRGEALALVPHPAFPPANVTAVSVALARDEARWLATFTVVGGPLLLPQQATPERTDDLWRATCFELFVKQPEHAEYVEFNLSPSARWAAYQFDHHRAGRRDFAVALAPRIERREDGITAALDITALPPPPWRVGINAVIHEADGTESFWALAHPLGKPDFHDDACFALAIPAAG